MNLQPTTLAELQEIVQQTKSTLLPYGGGSKPALSAPPEHTQQLNMRSLSGIIEYEPTEYTFTAYAGTPVQEIAVELAQHGQYLPFDPLLTAKGATLGGVVATNTAGAGRYRYGGVRDFILGVRFVDGNGRLVRSGGKVVKNSAGFDLPKFFVGSLGRYGVLAEISFKVFPQPQAYTTLRFNFATLDSALAAIHRLATTPFEMDALDLEPMPNDQFDCIIRLGGLPQALPARVKRLTDFLRAETAVQNTIQLQDENEVTYWQVQNSFDWIPSEANLVKIPITSKHIPVLENTLFEAKRRYTVGANIAWFADVDTARLDRVLNSLDLVGLQLWGTGQPYLGKRKGLPLAQRVKKALDPHNSFLEA
ncbi:MAG: FAD-binding protein [Anaerolineales bacterium]|nr:FAD-binding protein [Anaerolineales bacterium]